MSNKIGWEMTVLPEDLRCEYLLPNHAPRLR